MNSENSYELKPRTAEASQSTSPPVQSTSFASCWQRIKAGVLIVFTIGWCILLVVTIKAALNDSVLHESELKNIQNIASILFKLANLNILPISEPGSDSFNLDYLLKTLNERNSSETKSPLLQSG